MSSPVRRNHVSLLSTPLSIDFPGKQLERGFASFLKEMLVGDKSYLMDDLRKKIIKKKLKNVLK